jgi:hypothetical protein
MQVVDAAPGYAAKYRKSAGMGIKEHFVGLGVIRHQQVGTAGGQFDVGHFKAPVQATNDQVFGAPVKLEGFTGFECEGNESRPLRALALLFFPLTAEGVDLCLASDVADGPDGLVVGIDGASIPLGAVCIGLEPLPQLVLERVKQPGWALSFGIPWFSHLGLVQVFLGGVSGDVEPSGCLPHRYVVAQHQAAQFAEGSHVDHSCLPLPKNSAGYVDNVAQIWSEIPLKLAHFDSGINNLFEKAYSYIRQYY